METIVLAGCGGGYDVFGSMVLYHGYKESHNVILTNLSNTNPNTLKRLSIEYPQKVKEICYHCFEILPGHYADDVGFFPEYLLANQIKHSVFAICEYNSVAHIMHFYDMLLEREKEKSLIDVYLVDGGCDVVLSGNETGSTRCVEDIMHYKALLQIDKFKNIFVCAIGLNTDCNHGVNYDELVARLIELDKEQIIIGSDVLSLDDPKVKYYHDIFMNCKPSMSLVHSFVCSALHNDLGKIIPDTVMFTIGETNKFVDVSNLTKMFVICNGRMLANTIRHLGMIKNEMSLSKIQETLF